MKREIKFRAWCNNTHMIYQNDKTLGSYFDHTIDGFEYTIMQFTGLHDKNGKDIYEGDLIKCEGSTYVIKWNKILACFDNDMVNKPIIQGVNIVYMSTNGEVIGNIHENKDLLK